LMDIAEFSLQLFALTTFFVVFKLHKNIIHDNYVLKN
jgi:hypothetical protein